MRLPWGAAAQRLGRGVDRVPSPAGRVNGMAHDPGGVTACRRAWVVDGMGEGALYRVWATVLLSEARLSGSDLGRPWAQT
jgi:hypothetical protein